MLKKKQNEKKFRVAFGENLTKLMEEEKITQEQLAERIGVSVRSVSSWQTGSCFPSQNIDRLCEVFDEKLLFRRGDETMERTLIEQVVANEKKRQLIKWLSYGLTVVGIIEFVIFVGFVPGTILKSILGVMALFIVVIGVSTNYYVKHE